MNTPSKPAVYKQTYTFVHVHILLPLSKEETILFTVIDEETALFTVSDLAFQQCLY